MPARLYLAPGTDSAVRHALDQVRLVQRTVPLAPVYILLPDAASIHHLRRRLADSLNVALFDFYTLARHLLDRRGEPVHPLGDASLRRLLHYSLAEMQAQDELGTFRRVWNKPGFLQSVMEWLREMKSQGIGPAEVRETARNEQDHQLARLYERYERFLERGGYTDGEGVLWLVEASLAKQPDLHEEVGAILVLGFDQFSPVQRQILHHLATGRARCSLYLPWDQGQPADSLPLTRPGETRRRIEQLLQPEVVDLEETEPSATPLRQLRRAFFDRAASPVQDSRPPSIQAVAAPSREDEVRYALRQVKHLLLRGVPAHEIALVAPQPATYRRAVQAVAEAYGLRLRQESSLPANPAVAALLTLLQLAPSHEEPEAERFPWRETLNVLRSPYFRLPWFDPERIDLLDRQSRHYPVIAGREQWRFALHQAAAVAENEDGEETGHDRPSPEMLAALESALFRFFDHITPPAEESFHGYTLWLQEAILGLYEAGAAEQPPSLQLVAAALDGPYGERDRVALEQLLDGLRSLVEATTVLPPPGNGRITWRRYRTELFNILQRLPLLPPDQQEMVRFGPLEMGRAVAVDHLFILGLSEGEFPHPPRTDIFYTAAEREAHPLPLQRIESAEDASIWWQLLVNCRRTLTLLRPRIDDSDAPWEPSPYWERTVTQVAGLAQRVKRPPIAALPTMEEAACSNELLVALAARGADSVPPVLYDVWQLARGASDLQAQRQSRAVPGPFEGILQADDIREELAARYGPGSKWSPSKLNRYGKCPFGFFAKEVLALEPLPDPVEGWDVTQRGSLLHKILERLFHRLHREGVAPTTGNLERILAYLDGECERLFAIAPDHYGFRPDVLWDHEQRELRRMLRTALKWECEQNGEQADFRPFQQEIRFGLRDSDLPPLDLRSSRGIHFSLRGVIDRIDRREADGAAIVVDYKSGRTPSNKEDVLKGLSFQSTLYALAADQLLETVGAVKKSFCLHLPNRKHGTLLDFKRTVSEELFVQNVVELAAGFVEQAGDGCYPALPGKPTYGSGACSQSCEYASLCRVSRLGMAKARKGGEA